MAQANGVDRSSAHILIADDNADTQDFVTFLLLEQGYTVEVVADGVAALEAIRHRRPNLVLTDVMMPRLDGLELLRSLRADAQTRELPIILLSARAEEEARINGLKAGADAYLTKPFSNRELLVQIETCLKLATMRRESAQREYQLRTIAEAAQQAAEASATRLTQILESMGDAFVALDCDWRITYLNAAGEQINGKPRTDVLGKTCWEEWPALVGSSLEAHYRRAMAEQATIHTEHHYFEPPKHDLWLEIRVYPAPEGLSIFFRDISERKRLEVERQRIEASLQTQQLQLQQQLAEIETIYQSAPIGLNVIDRELRFVRVNERLAEMNGLPIEAHLGRTVRELLPNLADQAEAMLHRILDTGEPLLNMEISGETPAHPGIQRTWLESFWPLKDGDRIIGISTVCEEITERKRIEAERQQAVTALHQSKAELEQRVAERTADLQHINADLRQRKSILRSFFNSAAMLMGVVELHDDDILHISDNWAAAEFLGTTPPAMENRFASELGVSTATIRRWIAYYRQAEHTQAPVQFEYCHEAAEGTRWLAGSVCPIANSLSKHPRFSYIVEDITERKRAEVTLARSEEQLRLTLEFTHIGTWDWDVRQNRVIWNDNHFKLLGLDPRATEDPYQRWRKAIHPDDLDRIEQALQDALHQHTDYEAEYRVVHPDGSLRWLVGRGRGLYDLNQEPMRMLGVIIDISDRKRGEAERKQAENMQAFQAVITRNMAEGICVVRADNGMICYANRKFEQMFGYGPGELDGQHVSIVNYANEDTSAEDVNQSIRQAVLANQEATYEVYNVKKDGTPFWCSATTSVFEHPEYGMVLVAVQQDISDRKDSQEKLQASLKEKELLLKEIYHRVKNNLQVIYSLLNLQSRNASDSAALSVLRDSQSRIKAMALVHEKLYQSQDLTRIDLADYIQNLAYSLLETYQFDSRYIALQLEIEPYSLDIETALPCGLILTELISNSLKYAFPDGRTGKISITSCLSSDHRLMIRLQDDGIGLPDGVNLQQVSSLGLSLVKNLTQQIRGRVEIVPQPVGTIFQITFPA
ncbi:PAS domain S-box protein [Nodosilinea sp. LEGE 07298]|uniref:PAS domain S-box protein n=1 Tax=Nodosilinea sp. LEGE 07298 TaxID=2777970 RepID=UPI001882E530|nr:PAS domain S-box protein [Nodosilinea sp. LEGE 07298]MBE9113372.1 PAS domain S-box protein [Nodosilinea sp. LEGE 07298]